MNAAAGEFTRRILVWQAIVGVGAFASMALLAPRLLVFDAPVARLVLASGVMLATLSLVTTVVASALRLRAHRFALRSLALGSRAMEPDELAALAELPRAVTLRFFGIAALFSGLLAVPGVRPPMLDPQRAVSLVILSVTIVGAAAIPHFMIVRSQVALLFEVSPEEALATLLHREEQRKKPEARVRRRLLLAVAAPVALASAGALLITHAHLRTFVERSRTTTAVDLARGALDASPGELGEAGRDDAAAAAAPFGYAVSIAEGPRHGETTLAREHDGRITATVPLEDGAARIRFSADLDPMAVSEGAALGLLAVLVASVLGVLLGGALFDDLALATYRVRLVGTESAMRGEAEIARPARFLEVARLGRAIEALAARFGEFAAAQERALEARERAQRMRGLLFASVSHDLKSPLNAILGFAELLSLEDLSDAQRESLALIETRGRELLALIETILDAARVDSGQLALAPLPRPVSAVVSEAARKALDLALDYEREIPIEVAEGLPQIPVDPAHLTRSVAVIVAHALRTAASDPNARHVRLRASLRADPALGVVIDVEHGSKTVPPAELEALFARQSSSRGRGLTLGLNLARSVIELHGGSVAVDGGPDAEPVVHCYLPLEEPKPGAGPKVSTQPALG
jgi:signal transduction histidine kinase